MPLPEYDTACNPALVIIQARATQFDGPFYKYLAEAGRFTFRVYFTETADALRPYDPEISRHPDWSSDTVSGYPYSVFPVGVPARLRMCLSIVTARPSLIIVSGWRSFEGCLILLLANFVRIPVGLRADNCLPPDGAKPTPLLKRLARACLFRLFTTGHPVGTLAAEYMISCGLDRSRLFEFPYLVDRDSLTRLNQSALRDRRSVRANLRIQPDDFVIVGVMKFVDREDPLTLVRAFSSLQSMLREASDRVGKTDAGGSALRKPNRCHLILIGDGPLRSEIEELISTEDADLVHMPGYVSYGSLPSYFAISDVLVHSAKGESWGVTVNEALVCGLPVIAADSVGSTVDLIESGVNGFTFPSGNSPALAELLKTLLRKPELVTEMKAASMRPKALSRFTSNSTANSLASALDFARSGRTTLEGRGCVPANTPDRSGKIR